MSLQLTEQFQSNTRTGQPRAEICRIQPKTFASGSGTLAKLTPVAKNSNTGFYEPWTVAVSEVTTITKAGTVSGGTYTITIDGETTSALAYNAANATILAALEALSNVAPGDVVLTGGGAAGVSTGALTITFGGKFKGQAFVISTGSGSLTGGGTYDVAHSTAGVTKSYGTDKIAGFVWPDAIVLSGSGEVIGNVAMAGTIHRDDIPLNGNSQAALDEALKNGGVREKDFIIQGLAGF